ncbi:MAG: hypothetical protein JNM14_00455 [Ferruginibacter sp.]|nr:hypothetical protein [Ferruginibacter sp.]
MAIECAPELRSEFQADDLTPYDVFMELLPILRKAHIDKDNERLEKIYSYAAWCHQQKDKKLWNAAGVSFYEHLADTDETFTQLTNWIKKEIYFDIRNLLYQRTDEEKIKSLDKYYGYKTKK